MHPNKTRRWILPGLLACSLLGTLGVQHISQAQAATVTTALTPADAQTTKVVNAANAFLGTLSAAQKKAVQFAWTDSAQRQLWSNFPTGNVQRRGVKWGDLNTAQRSALTNLLAAVLSPEGLKMVQQQMDADEVLKTTDSGGGRLIFGSAEYYVSFLGTPSATSPWTLQFGGHHLALNATVVGGNITLAPSLTGGQPVKYTLDGEKVQIVEKEVTDALAMLGSLSADQKAKAIISTRSADLVLGPGHDGQTLQPEGLPGSAMTAAQKTKLLALIRDRLGALNADDLAPRLCQVKFG